MKVNGVDVTLNPKVETIVRSLLIGFNAFKWAGIGALDGGRVSANSMPMGLSNNQLIEVPIGVYDSVHQEVVPLPWQMSACALAGGKAKEIMQCLMQMEYVSYEPTASGNVAVVSADASKAKSEAYTTIGALVAAVELWYDLQGVKHGAV
ncbi:hypothetical protein vBAspABolek_18 [Aeromonas phage vB_AspA_Bolek]|nr:hypothetical protein vBAspABolek_18 [Aeromonas phage vB_AspA_Bolek]